MDTNVGEFKESILLDLTFLDIQIQPHVIKLIMEINKLLDESLDKGTGTLSPDRKKAILKAIDDGYMNTIRQEAIRLGCPNISDPVVLIRNKMSGVVNRI